MNSVLVTGGKGQLASCIKEISSKFKEHNFIFVDIDDLDITNKTEVEDFFNKNKITHCINCAAYTAVDLAETNEDVAKSVNADGPRNLALASQKSKATLIHISTDFVFDGKQTELYCEEDVESPLGVYGATKLLGEKEIAANLKEHFTIRTSWLYSEHGNNFLKTMLRLGAEKDSLSIVSDQIGTPTYAGDLASLVIDIIQNGNVNYGTYHYSNEGVASWYDFAVVIFELSKLNVNVVPVKSIDYKTVAKRPKFSVMDKSKIKKTFGVQIPHWRESLQECLYSI